MPPESLQVNPEDYLGRSVASRTAARYANRRGILKRNTICPRQGETSISVDKLIRSATTGQCEYSDEHVRIAEQRAKQISGTFYGWGFFTREEVESNTQCSVQPTPMEDDNPYHVHIEFPETILNCREKRNEVADELRKITKWLEYRDPTIDVEHT